MLIVQLAECKLILYNIVKIPGKMWQTWHYLFPLDVTSVASWVWKYQSNDTFTLNIVFHNDFHLTFVVSPEANIYY